MIAPEGKNAVRIVTGFSTLRAENRRIRTFLTIASQRAEPAFMSGNNARQQCQATQRRQTPWATRSFFQRLRHARQRAQTGPVICLRLAGVRQLAATGLRSNTGFKPPPADVGAMPPPRTLARSGKTDRSLRATARAPLPGPAFYKLLLIRLLSEGDGLLVGARLLGHRCALQ